MNIGIVGEGVVGSAIKCGFERLGHDVFIHDIKYGTTIDVVLNTEVCYICVPTPSKDDGSKMYLLPYDGALSPAQKSNPTKHHSPPKRIACQNGFCNRLRMTWPLPNPHNS